MGASHPTEPRAERHSHLGSLANLKPDERTHVPVLDPSHDHRNAWAWKERQEQRRAALSEESVQQ